MILGNNITKAIIVCLLIITFGCKHHPESRLSDTELNYETIQNDDSSICESDRTQFDSVQKAYVNEITIINYDHYYDNSKGYVLMKSDQKDTVIHTEIQFLAHFNSLIIKFQKECISLSDTPLFVVLVDNGMKYQITRSGSEFYMFKMDPFASAIRLTLFDIEYFDKMKANVFAEN